MTIASPSRFVVADIKWLVREFQRFPPMARKNFWRRKNDTRNDGLQPSVNVTAGKPSFFVFSARASSREGNL